MGLLHKFLVVAGLTTVVGSPIIFRVATREAVTITVTDKERLPGSKDVKSKYLVYATKADGKEEVFENTDAILSVKFNSSDIQGHLKPNQQYKVTVNGWRAPFFSAYRNIVKVEDIKPVPKAQKNQNSF